MTQNEKFKIHFNLPQGGFSESIDLIDVGVGFSVYKERAEPGFKSLFRVFVKKNDYEGSLSLKPIFVTASYGKESEEGIIIQSSEFKRGLSWPIDLISEGDFFYNIKTDSFIYKNKIIEGFDILKKVDGWHMKPTKVSGTWLKLKLFWFHRVVAGWWRLIFSLIAALQYLASGEKVKIFYNFNNPRYVEPLDIKTADLIDLWGYKVKPWIAGTYSAVHLGIYLVFFRFNYKPLWIVTIFRNDFLTLVYGILSLGLANTFLPILFKPIELKGLLKIIQTLCLNAAFRKVRIS